MLCRTLTKQCNVLGVTLTRSAGLHCLLQFSLRVSVFHSRLRQPLTSVVIKRQMYFKRIPRSSHTGDMHMTLPSGSGTIGLPKGTKRGRAGRQPAAAATAGTPPFVAEASEASEKETKRTRARAQPAALATAAAPSQAVGDGYIQAAADTRPVEGIGENVKEIGQKAKQVQRLEVKVKMEPPSTPVKLETAGDDASDNERIEQLVPVKKKKPPKNRHVVHEIGESHVRRELPDPETLPSPPVPNLGYCCLNVSLKIQKPQVFCNRHCILKTFTEKGLDYIGQMALQNCRDLEPILWWNHDHGIRLFRLSSNFFPWSGKYAVHELPTYEAIKAALARAGQVARATGQRVTSHPSEYVKLAATRPELLAESLADLEMHGQVFDMMGYAPSHWNKVNIHVGGAYGDKAAAMQRFAASWRQLSPGVQARLTVENDDRGNLFAVSDLLWLHKEIGIPIVFDFHHYRFCPGTLSAEESLKAAVATWPAGVRPVVHWSESSPKELGKREHAHSDFVGQHGPLVLHGMQADVDVMIEAKAKELALLQYRDVAANGPLLKQTGWDGVEYPGRPRSLVLEGIEMLESGDARLQSRGHKVSVVKIEN